MTNNDDPPPPPGFNGGGNGGSSGGGSGGGGVPPPPTVNGLIRPVIYPWPPPNAIVLHAATPIQLSQAGTGLRVYFINRDGTSDVGPFFDTFSILAHHVSHRPSHTLPAAAIREPANPLPSNTCRPKKSSASAPSTPIGRPTTSTNPMYSL